MSSQRQILRSSENVSNKENPTPEPQKIGLQQLNAVGQSEAKNGPPKPPRSAFMCFTDAKKKEIMSQQGIQKEDVILKIVAKEWKSLSTNSRIIWEEEARNDKIRFVREKAAYKGPWQIPKRRAKKHPLAPKRPMSAFLKYSQTRRTKVKEENPDMSNTDVSRLLGEMWRNASPRERAPYVEQEERERAVYKEDIKRWREKQSRLDAASRTSHQSVSVQNYSSHHHAQPSEQPYRGGLFENLQIDSFDEPARPFYQPYGNHYSQYHHKIPSSSSNLTPKEHCLTEPRYSLDVPLHHGSEIGEGDPIPLTTSSQMDEDVSLAVQYGNNQGSFFADNFSLGYYSSRYP